MVGALWRWQDVWHCEICGTNPGRGFGKWRGMWWWVTWGGGFDAGNVEVVVGEIGVGSDGGIAWDGAETTVEVLPRLMKMKFDSGIQEELLFVDVPHEYRQASGHMVLKYGKAIQESVFEQLRVVREGQLRIVFSAEWKVSRRGVRRGGRQGSG